MKLKYYLLQYLKSSLSNDVNPSLKIHTGNKSSGIVVIEKLLNPDEKLGTEVNELLTVVQSGITIIKLSYFAGQKDRNIPASLVISGPQQAILSFNLSQHYQESTLNKELLVDPIFKQYRSLILASLTPGRWKASVKIAAGILLAGGVILALLTAYATSVSSRLQLANTHAAGSTQTQLVATEDQLDQSELLLLRDVVQESGIPSIRPGAPFVVFSDPNCPSCQAFEKSMKAANWPFNPLVVPVSFKPGSEAIVAGVLCASNPSQAWEEVMNGKVAPPCDKGRIQAAKINGVFAALRLSNTPTFISSGGRIFKGGSDVRELLKWVQSNYPAGAAAPQMPMPAPAAAASSAVK